ncbi:MAG: TatD family hydrolase [Patescibacteria group bacterium]
MKWKLIDSHAHVNFRPFQDDWHQVIERAHEASVGVMNVGSQLSTSRRSVEVAQEFSADGVWAAVGLHPTHLAEDHVEEDVIDGEKISFTTRQERFDHMAYLGLAQRPEVVAIGECGLDYYRLPEDAGKKQEYITLQKDVLKQQIGLALQVKKPNIFHCREAYDDFLKIVEKYRGQVRGVVHCYTGDADTVERLVAAGLYVGFTGIITFPKTEYLAEAVKRVPLDRLLVETDCPYLAPVPYRGKRNEPAYVEFVAQQVAKIKGISFDLVCQQTEENTRKLFKLNG